MIDLSTLLKHYKRADIQEEIIANAQNKEVAIKFGDGGFGKRPDMLKYPKDILELAKQGATSFHASEELWRSPLQLDPMMKRHDLENLRIGWDLVLDIDCHFLEYSKIGADLAIKALQYHKVKSISCKFSGNKGFHIGVPFEAFPEKIGNNETRLLFPEGARRIALYIKEMIKRPLGDRILALENNDFSAILRKTGKSAKEITYFVKDKFDSIPKLNAEPFLNIDTILISSRHLYRMAYSFNEKSGLISVPVNLYKVLDFRKEIALPKNVKISKFRFLDRRNVEKNEAKQLIIQAFDFSLKQEEIKIRSKEKYEEPKSALQKEYFPPCIKNILKGLEDGRKRSLFILTNFLTNVGWDYDKIETKLKEWNKKNQESLRDTLILGQIRYHKQKKKKILPPNCQNQMYYKDMRVCTPDNLCSKIKNPVNYAMIKARGFKKTKKDK